ncbi:hypothetical protein DAERI_010167 [Deinococcus aerius]|uniref:Bacterial Pleckstrin homology domain-containing protein n=1 Tax=Deinococcus aerius TaxID=200253 RepID=A0A2I9DUI3_9DEIO|nr:PH domain-containing protein [Deinococcus aerius]GBF03995.1 hypothetical protein DAERI_010167 [Deinococcus aerius]
MNQAVTLAPAEAPLILRLLVGSVPLVLVGVAMLALRDAPAVGLLVGVLGLLLLGLFQLAPRRLAYTLTPDALVVTRLLGRTVLPYAGMRARRTAGHLGWRTLGTGLPGYLTGHFTFGPDFTNHVLAASSRPDGGVIVESGGRAYFLTPADPEGLLRVLERRGVQVAL